MLVRRAIGTLVVTGFLVTACASSQDSADPASIDAAADTVATPQPTDGAPTDTAAPADESSAPDETAESEEPVVTDDADDIQMFPDVIGAEATFDGSTWTVAATLSSPYDTPERYADAWRVVGPDGTVFGERILTHDHASEQPFTRSQSGIEIPDDVTTVTIEGRDQQFGYGGDTFELTLPR